MADVQNKTVKLGQLGSALTSFAAKADTRFVKKDGFDASVKTIAAQELAAQLIPENAKESMDTLQEIAAWIQAHPDDASALNEAVQALRTKATLGTYTEGDGDAATEKEYETVKAYVEAYVAAQISGIDTNNLVEKVEGKGLSTNDFTDEYKAKMDSIDFATDAEVDAIVAGIWSETQPATPTDTPENA